jgi:hypothetical protein
MSKALALRVDLAKNKDLGLTRILAEVLKRMDFWVITIGPIDLAFGARVPLQPN